MYALEISKVNSDNIDMVLLYDTGELETMVHFLHELVARNLFREDWIYRITYTDEYND